MHKKMLPLWLILLLISFPLLSETIYSPALPNIAETLGTDVSMVEWTLSVYFLGFALGVGVWGVLADVVGRKLSMLVGIVIYFFGCWGCWKAPTIDSLMAWRVVQAFGASVGSVITMTMMRDLFVGKEKTKVFSIAGVSVGVAPAIGTVLGGYLTENFGWRSNFLTLMIFSCGLLSFCFCFLRETKHLSEVLEGKKRFLDCLSQLLKDQRIWGHALMIGATNGLIFSFYSEGPFLLIDTSGFTPEHYGFLGLFIAASTILASILSYRLNKKMNPEKVIFIGFLCALIGSLLATVVAFLTPFNPLLFIPCILIVFFGDGLVIPNSLSIALIDYIGVAGTAGSVLGVMYYILIACFTAIMGLIHNGSVYPMPVYFIFLSLLILVGFRLIRVRSNDHAIL
jgi:Bcr/CflA subfamily drug resistance transporter